MKEKETMEERQRMTKGERDRERLMERERERKVLCSINSINSIYLKR